jgi:hypothetical protein
MLKWISSGLSLALLGSCLIGLIGCGEDNEKASGITGVAPTSSAPTSYADASAKMKGAPGGGGQNYPGAARQEAKQKPAEKAKN